MVLKVINLNYNKNYHVLGLISPGVSVPVQVPAGQNSDLTNAMTAAASNYWPRI